MDSLYCVLGTVLNHNCKPDGGGVLAWYVDLDHALDLVEQWSLTRKYIDLRVVTMDELFQDC